MPTITGTSTGTYQIVGNLLFPEDPKFDLLFDDPPSNDPRYLGYFYVLGFDDPPSVVARILARGVVSTPGLRIFFPTIGNFGAVPYTLGVRWRVPGQSWTLTYE